MKKQQRKSWAMAYCGIVAALCVALMLLGAVIPIAMFIAPAVAGFLIATVCVECGRTMALTAYAAVSLLAVLFVPDKEVALIFVFLLGYYPLVKPRFERIRPALLRGAAKLALCNGSILLLNNTAKPVTYTVKLEADTGTVVGMRWSATGGLKNIHTNETDIIVVTVPAGENILVTGEMFTLEGKTVNSGLTDVNIGHITVGTATVSD